MSFISTHADRRAFLRRSRQLASLAGSPFALNLALMGAASAQGTQEAPYRALVCLNLGGGNDNSNTIVPRSGTPYADYARSRGALALPADTLRPVNLAGWSGPELGLHPSLARLQGLVNGGQAALVANVGTLTQALTQTQWNRGWPTVKVPYQLFSHSDQGREWQTGIPDGASRSGWLGRSADLLASMNSSAASICMSMAGSNMIQVGNEVVPYQMTAAGPIQISKLDNPYDVSTPALRQLLTDRNRTHVMERELTRIARRAIDNESQIRGAIAATASMATFGGGALGAQLRMVARMIAARSALGFRRQVFYVSHGGYDFHADLLKNHADRLAEVDAAVYQFYQTMAELGLGNQVTLFSMSEFGRSLQSNGDGADHGWGGHHFVVGDAVKGQRLYGQWPTVVLKGPEDAGNGRLIPSTAVDQYAATLASWMGVGASELGRTVLPNLGRFASSNLGFMNA